MNWLDLATRIDLVTWVGLVTRPGTSCDAGVCIYRSFDPSRSCNICVANWVCLMPRLGRAIRVGLVTQVGLVL